MWKKLTLCLSQRFLAWLYFLAWYSIYATIAEKNSLFTTPNNEWWHFIVWQCKITLNNALCKWPVKRFCTLKGNVVSNILTVKKIRSGFCTTPISNHFTKKICILWSIAQSRKSLQKRRWRNVLMNKAKGTLTLEHTVSTQI